MNKLKITNTFSEHSDAVIVKGDCLDLLNKIPDGSLKLIITSPPYNIGKTYETKLDLNDYLDQQRSVIKKCVEKLHEAGSICWQVGNNVNDKEIIPLDIVLYPIFKSYGLKLRNRIIWHFGHGLHASKRLSGRYEVILWFTKNDEYTFNLDQIRVPQKYPNKKHFKGPKKGELSGHPLGKNPSDVWEIPNVKANHIEKTIHPCQFPVELVERLVLALTNEGDWVFDPFLGVGSTVIAALMHKRRAIGSDIMQEYINITLDRITKAQNGKLLIRPMNRDVFEPNGLSNYIPPKKVTIGVDELQLRVVEKHKRYNTHRRKIK